ncbi:MAG: galactokinase [Oscillospiraceae bacterium]|nr:galactokinase [Oscillospiraceae bacterium]
MHTKEIIRALESGALDSALQALYPADSIPAQRTRYAGVVQELAAQFGEEGDILLFSAPGRTELGGNHTDHQGGHVLAGSVDLDIIAAVRKTDSGVIRLKSSGFPLDTVSLDTLTPVPEETGTSAALLRGIAARFTELGYPVTGFDACTVSNVLRGSGLSSSAAFEVLAGRICSELFAGGAVDAVQIAQIGQYAENVFFGKPCGLMDQMACSVGGVIAIDFGGDDPVLTRADADPEREGYALCILDSGADHADLTDAYAAIPAEMCTVANALGAERLSGADKAAFFRSLPELRKRCGDRAVLRAMHYFRDDARVMRQIRDLQNGDFAAFLQEVTASGHSSAQLLQNVSTYTDPSAQAVALTIALCEELLAGRGAVRVHGGGFAGTVQAYVPLAELSAFKRETEAVLGEGRCHVLHIRSAGAVMLTPINE